MEQRLVAAPMNEAAFEAAAITEGVSSDPNSAVNSYPAAAVVKRTAGVNPALEPPKNKMR